VGWSAKSAPNCALPEVETPTEVTERAREPVVPIFVPVEGR
jgi:hypothetical protein